MLTSVLTPDQVKLIQDFITTANKRLQEKENKKLLTQQTAYNFTNFQVPQNFQFGQGNQNVFSPQ
jgi:hypothetical protein